MPAKDVEELLWQLARGGSAEGPPEEGRAGDDTLEAYRLGRLSPQEEKRVERLLSSDPEARQRLARLAGVELPLPASELRQRILAAAPAGAARDGAGAAPSGAGTRRWWIGVAAAAAALLLAVFLRPTGPGPGLPPGLEYEVRASGLADSRGGEVDAGATVEAWPETRVRLTVEPRGEAVSDIGFSVYREAGGRLRRLAFGAPLALRVERGAALVEGPAATLAGSTAPGLYRLWMVVHRQGDPPAADLPTTEDGPAAALSQGSRRRAYPLQIRLLPAASAGEQLEEEQR